MLPAGAQPAGPAIALGPLRRYLVLSVTAALLPALLDRFGQREEHGALQTAGNPRPVGLLFAAGERSHRDYRRKVTADVATFFDVARECFDIPLGGVDELGLERLQQHEVGGGSIARVDVHLIPRDAEPIPLAETDRTMSDASIGHADLYLERLVQVQVNVRDRKTHPRPHHAPDLELSRAGDLGPGRDLDHCTGASADEALPGL